ncbi:MAG TPA: GH25 family lysozyme [Myxococcales bacterium]|nr:GH25 family lysozyme [Myxococcales bacterium]
MTRRIQIAVLAGALAACGPQAPDDVGNTQSDAADLTVCLGKSTLQGIDVSADQPDTDWASVKKAGKVFAAIQAVDGITSDNPDFARDWKAAGEAGVVRGPYQFFRPGDDPTTEANHFVALVNAAGGFKKGDLPPMLDWEVYDDDSGHFVPGSTAAAEAQTWLNVVEKAFGVKPIIYTYTDFFPGYYTLPESFASYPLWIANVGVSCPTVPAPWTKFAIWQYGQGSVSGVTTSVDLDVFDGDLAALSALGGAAPPPPQVCGGTPKAPPRAGGCGGLREGEGLARGEAIHSCDGRFALALQDDGKLVLSSYGITQWEAKTNGAGYVAVMQGDGNFVVYGDKSCADWASGTDRHPGAELALQDDGNLVVYDNGRALWSTVTGGLPEKPTACGAIEPDHGLAPGESVKSCDGRHELVMQGDGNLVLYHVGGAATWASKTNGTPSRDAVMQGDGNLVVYEKDGHATFATHTNGHDGASLAVQDDGNLVIYEGSKAIWASGTEGK